MRLRRAHGGPLEQLSAEHRVVVAMTTIPQRIDRIEVVLDSMLAQTWPLAALYLSIPFRYNRTGEPYVIPDWLRSKQGVRIARCEDLGPGTHLLNALRLERNPWTFIILVDDDHIYSPTLVESLMRPALANPGVAVAAQGFLSVPGLRVTRESPRYLHDQGFPAGPVLVSYLGVVYQRGFFDSGVYDYRQVAPECRYQDDMWFSAHLAAKGIRRGVLGAALGVQELRHMHLGPESLTMWQEQRPRQVSDRCNLSLLRLQPRLWEHRRRLVFVVAGLPLPPRPPAHFYEGGSCSAQLAAAPPGDPWGAALAALRQLPQPPDLTYLCAGEVDSTPEPPGLAFCLGGVLVTAASSCLAGDPEPRVGRMLTAPLQWEGDDGTVVVLGSITDFAAQDAADVKALTDCVAQKFPISTSDDSSEEADAATARGAGLDSPFCRVNGLVATSVGGIAQTSGS